MTLILEIKVPVDDSDVKRRDSQQKAKQKKCADKLCLRNTGDMVNVGETVFIKQHEKNKLSPHFNIETISVVGVKGSIVTAHNPSLGSKKRNVSQFKRAHDIQYITQPAVEPKDLTHEENSNPVLSGLPQNVPDSSSAEKSTAQCKVQRPKGEIKRPEKRL